MLSLFPSPVACVSKADATTETPAISATPTVDVRKSSVMMTDVASKVEKLPTPAPSGSATGSLAETEEEKAKRLLYCSLCKVAVNSASQLEAHNSGEI